MSDAVRMCNACEDCHGCPARCRCDETIRTCRNCGAARPPVWRWRDDDKHKWTFLTPCGQQAATVEACRGPTADAMAANRPTTQAEWVTDGDLHGWVWCASDPDGVVGQNSRCVKVSDAKWEAAHVAKVWWYEERWVTIDSPEKRHGSVFSDPEVDLTGRLLCLRFGVDPDTGEDLWSR